MNILNILSLFLTATFPVVLIIIFLHKKDKNKEPNKLLIKLFIGGMLSVALTLLLSIAAFVLLPFYGMKEFELTRFELIVETFIGIALVEEYSKWFFTYKIGYKSQEFDEPYDMLLYSGIVALGFAFVENLMYVFDSGLSVGFLRSITAVPGHACDGIFMGYYLYLAKVEENNSNVLGKNVYKFLSLFVPMMLHGTYDLCLTDKFSVLGFVFPFFVIFLFIKSIKKINKISKKNIKLNNLKNRVSM